MRISAKNAYIIRKGIGAARSSHRLAVTMSLVAARKQGVAGAPRRADILGVLRPPVILAPLNTRPPRLFYRAYERTMERLPRVEIHHRNCRCSSKEAGE